MWNVGIKPLLVLKLFLFSILLMGCSEGVPDFKSLLGLSFSGPLINGNKIEKVIIGSSSDPISIAGSCDKQTASLLWSFDKGATWQIIDKQSHGINCENSGSFSISISDISQYLTIANGETKSILLQAESKDGKSSEHAELSILLNDGSAFKLVLTGQASSYAGECVPVTITAEDSLGNPTPIQGAGLLVSLLGNGSGFFYPVGDFACGGSVSTASIPSAQSSIVVYFKSLYAGSYNLDAYEPGINNSQVLTHQVGPSRLSFSPLPSPLYKGTCVPITMTTQDEWFTPANVSSTLTIGLSTDDVGQFFSDSSCGSSIFSAEIASGQNSTTIYYSTTSTGETLSFATSSPMPTTSFLLPTTPFDVPLSFDVATSSAAEATPSVNIGFSIPVPLISPLTISYNSSGGTATSGADFLAVSGSTSIPAGDTAGTINITLSDDIIDEYNETILLSSLAFSLSHVVAGGITSHTLTINDDDPEPEIYLAAITGEVGESDGNYNVDILLSNPSEKSITFNMVTLDGTALGSTDFASFSGNPTYPTAQTTYTIPISITDDDVTETSESFGVKISSPTNATLVKAKSQSIVTIIDNDDPAPNARFARSLVYIDEGDQLRVDVVLDRPDETDSEVLLVVNADSTVTEGVDFTTPGSYNITIPAGSVIGSKKISINTDGLFDWSTASNRHEELIFDLVSVSNVTTLPGQLVVKVRDVDLCLDAGRRSGNPFAYGAGSLNDPFVICSGIQLDKLGQRQSDWGSSKHFVLGADIDLGSFTGKSFNIIGNNTTYFEGKFDGSGYQIYNFEYIDASQSYVGLFGKTGSQAVVKNIHLAPNKIEGDAFVGALIGDNEGFVFRNAVTGHGLVVGNSVSATGGLVGGNWNSSGIVDKNYSTISVATNGIAAGGFVGANLNSGMVMENYSTGPVKSVQYAGGFIGYQTGASTYIYYSFSLGTVEGNYGPAPGVGPFAGLNGGNFTEIAIGSSSKCDNLSGSCNLTGVLSTIPTPLFSDPRNPFYINWDLAGTWIFPIHGGLPKLPWWKGNVATCGPSHTIDPIHHYNGMVECGSGSAMSQTTAQTNLCGANSRLCTIREYGENRKSIPTDYAWLSSLELGKFSGGTQFSAGTLGSLGNYSVSSYQPIASPAEINACSPEANGEVYQTPYCYKNNSSTPLTHVMCCPL